jgi:predicted enzyme related to lactoylglutathione lyase
MFKNTNAFYSFSVDDVAKAKEFYGGKLGIEVSEQPEGLSLKLAGAGNAFIYSKKDHQPATFTVLNFQVDDIDQTVDEFSAAGIKLESFEGDIETDEKGVFRGAEKGSGPNIAWFKDPAGNYLSVIEDGK